jgi:signal transduction histidine kinase
VPAGGRWDDEDARLLSSTFGQLTSALGRFQREVAQRERLSSLGRLSTVVAHEVRNPLMIIKATVRRLRRTGDAEVLAAAESIDEEVRRLDGVVSGVLDFARPLRFELTDVDLCAICRDAVAAVGVSAPGQNVALDLPDSPVVLRTDAERIRSVLVNLLANAHDATRGTEPLPRPPSGEAPVVVRLRPLAAGAARLQVEDRGTGIAPEHLKRLFEPFFTTKRTGSGLGLAIARNIVEGLGGVIRVASRPAAGTTVTIELPAAAPEKGQA